LLSRTPYDAKGATQRNISPVLTEALPVMDAEFVSDGYIRVYQDIRGMHNSEGDFVMTRPIIGPLNHTTIDESTDAYDKSSHPKTRACGISPSPARPDPLPSGSR
jgi:predicted acyl esterase